jgi:hypothetical protein
VIGAGNHPKVPQAIWTAIQAAIPMARFQLLTATGHIPQLETPTRSTRAVWGSADTRFSSVRAT